NKTGHGNGDSGWDLTVQHLGCTVLIQCKKHKRGVGIEYADEEVAESPYLIKLTKVNEKENKIVKDLEDFVALNLHVLVEREGIEVVLCNAVMVTNKRIEELDKK
ncbi:804_t:CDS:2, partial [Paraglomus occultum]